MTVIDFEKREPSVEGQARRAKISPAASVPIAITATWLSLLAVATRNFGSAVSLFAWGSAVVAWLLLGAALAPRRRAKVIAFIGCYVVFGLPWVLAAVSNSAAVPPGTVAAYDALAANAVYLLAALGSLPLLFAAVFLARALRRRA